MEGQQGNIPILREHKHLAEAIDEYILEAIEWDAESATYLRSRRGNIVVVYNGLSNAVRKVFYLTYSLTEIKTADPDLTNALDRALNFEGGASPERLARMSRLFRRYLALLYEKGVVQVRK